MGKKRWKEIHSIPGTEVMLAEVKKDPDVLDLFVDTDKDSTATLTRSGAAALVYALNEFIASGADSRRNT